MAASSIGMIVSAVNPMYTKGNSYNICILIWNKNTFERK
jgi:hypothetical protein